MVANFDCESYKISLLTDMNISISCKYLVKYLVSTTYKLVMDSQSEFYIDKGIVIGIDKIRQRYF